MGLDFMPDERSVYFTSLAKRTDEYTSVYNQGQRIIEKMLPSLDIKKNEQAQQKIQQALQMLQTAANNERATEQQYINDLLNNFNNQTGETGFEYDRQTITYLIKISV